MVRCFSMRMFLLQIIQCFCSSSDVPARVVGTVSASAAACESRTSEPPPQPGMRSVSKEARSAAQSVPCAFPLLVAAIVIRAREATYHDPTSNHYANDEGKQAERNDKPEIERKRDF